MMKRSVVLMCVLIICGAMNIAAAAQSKSGEMKVRGSLAQTVEAGGWVINSNAGKYLFLNAAEYQSRAGFRVGAIVEATGEIKSDVMTIYQEGTPFQVRELVMISRGGNENSMNNANDTAAAMTTMMGGKTQVIVAGDSIVQAQPDTAIISIGVVTQNKSALNAQSENATKTDAVVRAVKAAVGASAEVKTSGYNLQPQRVYKENQPPTITGYEARNSVTVTLSDLTRVGSVIDAASTAGANNVDNLAFTLRRDQAAKAQALRDATAEAMAKAQTIAQALGGRVVRIVEVQEEGTMRPRPYEVDGASDSMMTMAKSTRAATPVEVGSLDISSRVQLVAEIETISR